MSGEKILIVVDETQTALYLQQALDGSGYSVAGVVDSGTDAIRWAEELRPDVVLVDTQLRGAMDGIEAARRIRARLGLPVVFLTASAEDPRLRLARDTNPYSCLVRPIQERELRGALEMALYRHGLDLKLKESETGYRELYRNIPAMLHTTDPQGRILQVSDYWLAVLGYAREDVLGHLVTEYISSPPASHFLEAYIPRSRGSAPTRDVECQFVRSDGQLVDALFSAVSVFDAQGLLLYTHSAVTDITARKRAEAAERDQRTLAEALRETAAALNTTLSLEEVLERVLAYVGEVVPYQAVNIMTVDDGTAHVVRSRGFGEHEQDERALAHRMEIRNARHLRAMAETAQPVILPDTLADPGWEIAWVRSYAGAPIIVKERLVGFINLFSLEPGYYNPDLVSRLQVFADQAAIAIENANLYAEVQRLATLDALTNVYNRRSLFELGEREFERARRYQLSLSAILLDIDHFKKVNDTYGHTVGDQVLSGIALAISRNIREIDVFGRYGGEEFVVLLPQADTPAARDVAERLRILVAELVFTSGRERLSVTISLGVSGIAEDVPSLSALIDRADQAMYAAKQAGRNCVMQFD